jgi:diacylglycerol kinase (ATP)
MLAHEMHAREENPFKSRGGLRRGGRASIHSIDGLVVAFRLEAAFRPLALLAILLTPIGIVLPMHRVDRAMLFGSLLLALIIELFNSAIDAAVDDISYDTHSHSTHVKDDGTAAPMTGVLSIAGISGRVSPDLPSDRQP